MSNPHNTTTETASPPGGRHPGQPSGVSSLTVEFFTTALGGDDGFADRITRTPTSVHIHLLDDGGITLRLDRHPPTFHAEIVGSAKARVTCSAATWVAALRGDRPLAMAIATGDAKFPGPVRPLLSFLPILRALDHSLWDRAQDTARSRAA